MTEEICEKFASISLITLAFGGLTLGAMVRATKLNNFMTEQQSHRAVQCPGPPTSASDGHIASRDIAMTWR